MEKLKVFVIMPFQVFFEHLYEKIKQDLGDKYDFSHAGDLDNQQSILKDIVIGINNADVVIADVTGLNSNVFYELGICHALNKKVIIITQNISELPFDIRPYRVNPYTTNFWEIDDIVDKIDKNLSGAMDDSVKFGSPVSDYLPDDEQEKTVENKTKANEGIDTKESKDVEEDLEEVEKGILDYYADINEDTRELGNEINEMNYDMVRMTKKINDGTERINEIVKVPSMGNTNLVRNVIGKVAGGIQEFADKMKGHNSKIEDTWGRIENNYLDLIDNKYIENEENQKRLVNVLKEIYNMKESIATTNSRIENMVDTFAESKGTEKRLTRAIISLEKQMGTYLSIMDAISASIDRIISKAELKVGKIDFDVKAD